MHVTKASLADILQTYGTLRHYHVPKYQRGAIPFSDKLQVDYGLSEKGFSTLCSSDHKARYF